MAHSRLTNQVKHSVLLVDDHPILQEGVCALINTQDDLTVCGKAASATEAMSALDSTHPDLVVVDLSLEDSDGTVLIRDIKAIRPDLPILVLSAYDEEQYAERSIRIGAMGYVKKTDKQDCLLYAIRTVLSGNIYLSERMISQVLGRLSDRNSETTTSSNERLSDREHEVLRLLGQGLTTDEIAKKLRISTKTVQRHKDAIRGKLELDNATKLQHYAYIKANHEF